VGLCIEFDTNLRIFEQIEGVQRDKKGLQVHLIDGQDQSCGGNCYQLFSNYFEGSWGRDLINSPGQDYIGWMGSSRHEGVVLFYGKDKLERIMTIQFVGRKK